MIKAVLFDINGVVLRNIDIQYYSRLAITSGMSAKRIYSTTGPLLEKFFVDAMTLDEYEERVAKAIHIGKARVQWLAFYKRHAEVDEQMKDLVTELQKNYKTGFISNTDRPRYEYAESIMSPDIYDYRIASCDVKMTKPHRDIFEYALKEAGVKPNEAVFIDNQMENAEGANAVGMHGIFFGHGTDLLVKLSELGVL